MEIASKKTIKAVSNLTCKDLRKQKVNKQGVFHILVQVKEQSNFSSNKIVKKHDIHIKVKSYKLDLLGKLVV